MFTSKNGAPCARGQDNGHRRSAQIYHHITTLTESELSHRECRDAERPDCLTLAMRACRIHGTAGRACRKGNDERFPEHPAMAECVCSQARGEQRGHHCSRTHGSIDIEVATTAVGWITGRQELAKMMCGRIGGVGFECQPLFS